MRFFLLTSLLLSFSVVWASSSYGSTDTLAIQLSWNHGFQFAGYYAAIEKGYYADAGVIVALREGGVKTDTVAEVVNGTAQYGVTNSELLLHRIHGDPVVVLAAVFQHSPHVFLTRSATGIQHPQDFIGKRVKMGRSDRDIELHAVLRNEGVPLDKLTVLEKHAIPEDYIDPSIDVVSAYITDQSYYLEKAGIPYTVIAPSTYGVDFYGDCLFTSEDEIRRNPERVAQVTAATLKGWAYAMAHPEEIIDIIIEQYGAIKSRDHLQNEAQKMQDLILPMMIELGHMNPGRWEHIGNTFIANGLIEPGFSLDGFIYSPNANLERKKLYRMAIPLVFVVLGCVLAATMLFVFNRRLKREVKEHKTTTTRLQLSQNLLQTHAKQTEQFSLSAASVLTIKDEKVLFSRISDAIVQYSDFSRVLISLFHNHAPYRELIGHAGVSQEIVAQVKNTELEKHWYNKVFEQGIKLGKASYYIPHTMKDILNQQATIYGEGAIPDAPGEWHPEDNLFVRMDDETGDFIGVISVDTAKSGLQPNDDVVRPLEIYASLISQIIILRRNQVEREQLQNQLRQAQKMEAIGNLTGGIAHDFNNILGIIIGNTELARLCGPQEREYADYLEQIYLASYRARDIVRHLLAFSRKTDQQLHTLKIEETLEESLRFLRSTIPSTITIKKRLALGDATILADPTQMHQIFLNLCTNAVHAMEEQGGTLTIESGLAEMESFIGAGQITHPAGTYVSISFQDTGHGIEEKLQQQIFDPYFTTKPVGKGTGMGLAIVHGILQSHNGAITVQSVPGSGSRFSLFLPLHATSYHDRQQSVETAPEGTGRILLIDDDLSLLTTTGKRLEKLGYTVQTTTSPLQALELLQTQPPCFDLVVTDMTMPEMTGVMLTKKILRLHPGIPVFLCTGYSDKIDAEKARELGVRHYFEKPVPFATFTTAIKKELSSLQHN